MKLKPLFPPIPTLLKKVSHYLDKKYSLQKKKEKLQKWSLAHPKKTITITMSLLILSFIITLIPTASKDEPMFSDIENIQPLLSQKRQIDALSSQMQSNYTQFILEAQTLKKELDSLQNLPSKTHLDSLNIYRKYKQLQIIVNHLSHEN